MVSLNCGDCGRFTGWQRHDAFTPWGCANPDDPEPYDPVILCVACSDAMRDRMLAVFLAKGLPHGYSDWQPSNAEMEARLLARAHFRLHGGRPVMHQRARERYAQMEHELFCTCGWRSGMHGRDACRSTHYLCAMEDVHRDAVRAPAANVGEAS